MLTGPLNLPAPGRRQSVYLNFHVFARTCVFNKQSLPSLLCDHHQLSRCQQPVMVPLLPKLRGHFAEFLNHSSPERLSILYLTTCVGFRYGPCTHSLEAFLDSTGTLTTTKIMVSASRLTLIRGADFPTPQATRLHSNPIRKPSYHSASPHHLTTTHEDPTHPHTPTKKTGARRRAVSTIRFITCRTHTGTGISTRHPSTTPVGLALGPDSPWEDKLHPGTLSHPADMFLTHQSLLMPAFSLAHTPPPVTK